MWKREGERGREKKQDRVRDCERQKEECLLVWDFVFMYLF